MLENYDLNLFSIMQLSLQPADMAETSNSNSSNKDTQSSESEITQLVEESQRCGWLLLNLSHRELRVVPQSISHLVSLQVLLLNNNGLIMPPGEITSLINLKCLSLEHNQLTLLPSEISKLNSTLQFLNLSHNPLTYLPPSISKLENLNELWLNCIKLTSFPVQVCGLLKLELLSLEDNSLPNIDEGVYNLANLRWFSLARNRLHSLKGERNEVAVSPVTKLVNLVTLKLQGNEFTEIPVELFSPSLLRLSNVDLRQNKISRLPDNMAELHASSAGQLVKLDIRENRLDSKSVVGGTDVDFVLL